MVKEYILSAHDGRKIICSVWDDVKRPVGVVQLVHGMDEDVCRYNRFAHFLNKNGYIVFGDDHRAHGRTAGGIEKIGKVYGDVDVFESTVRDEIQITKYLHKKYKLPVFLFGHGYGSFIVQKLLSQTDLCSAGVCMSAGVRYSRAVLWVARFVAWIGKSLWGMDACARFIEFWSPINGIISGPYQLTRDGAERKRRQLMQTGRKCFSYGFYYSLFKNLMELGGGAVAKMPLLIIGGGRDIFSLNGRLSRALYNAYKMQDLQNLTLIIYPQARHELLFDLDWKNVQKDILDFFNDNLRT